MFSCEYCKIFKNIYFEEHLWWLLLFVGYWYTKFPNQHCEWNLLWNLLRMLNDTQWKLLSMLNDSFRRSLRMQRRFSAVQVVDVMLSWNFCQWVAIFYFWRHQNIRMWPSMMLIVQNLLLYIVWILKFRGKGALPIIEEVHRAPNKAKDFFLWTTRRKRSTRLEAPLRQFFCRCKVFAEIWDLIHYCTLRFQQK